MSEVTSSVSVSTPIQTPNSAKDPQNDVGILENGKTLSAPANSEVNKPPSPPIPSPEQSSKHDLEAENEENDSNKRVKLESENVNSGDDDDVIRVEGPESSIKDDSVKEEESFDGPTEASDIQNGEQRTQETQQTQQNNIDYSQMTPAPKPAAEPDMNNLPSNPIPKHQQQFAIRILKIVRRMKDAAPFIHPVDIVKLKIPFYYNFITRPMDLTTIERKLNANAYEDVKDFVEDFNLMVENCIRFNGADSAIAQMARNIQASFEKHLLNMPKKEAPPNQTNIRRKQSSTPGELNSEGLPTIRRDSNATTNGRPKREIHPPKPKDMPYDIRPRKKKYVPELRFSQQILKELASRKYESFNYPFLEPVDPVALNCPTYFDFVKDPMDFSTIQNKLNNNQYENADEFEQDIRLVFKNCYVFNPEGSAVNMMGHRLEAIFDKKWADRPQTPQTPTQNSEYEYTSEESEDEVIDESSITNPAIQFLEEQLERMHQQLTKLKKEEIEKIRKERAGKKKSKKIKKRRRRSSDSGSIITYDMKKELSERINELPEKKLNQVLTIISESLNINNQNGEEIELDMDQLDNSTLLKLYNFVVKKKSSSSNSRRSTTNGKKSKKSKNLSEAEQSRQIENLKKKIELFDQSNNNNSSYLNSNNNDSDSDDDISSESSEEE